MKNLIKQINDLNNENIKFLLKHNFKSRKISDKIKGNIKQCAEYKADCLCLIYIDTTGFTHNYFITFYPSIEVDYLKKYLILKLIILTKNLIYKYQT